MKKLFLMLMILNGSLVCAQDLKLDLPATPELMEGETLADVDKQVNEAIKNFKDTYGKDPKTAAIITAFEAHYREFARLFKLYITNPTPNVLQAYYGANALIMDDIEKLKRANANAAQEFGAATLNKSIRIK